jgi:hypothetical protein
MTAIIQELRKLHEKTTPAPWRESVRGPNNMPVIGNTKGLMLAHVCTGIGFESEADANASLIVSMRNALPLLLDAAEKAERYEKAFSEWAKGCSCTEVREPWRCQECTEAYFKALTSGKSDT